jgi:tRNA A22 N-methylase
MKTVAEIRKYIQLNRHELTADRLEELETKMIEIENIECGIKAPTLTAPSAWDLVPHTSRFTDKAYNFSQWYKELEVNDQFYVASHFETIYKKNTSEAFRLKKLIK